MTIRDKNGDLEKYKNQRGITTYQKAFERMVKEFFVYYQKSMNSDLKLQIMKKELVQAQLKIKELESGKNSSNLLPTRSFPSNENSNNIN